MSIQGQKSVAPRLYLREPIPEIADAACYLDEAVSAHLLERFDDAEELIRLADIDGGEDAFVLFGFVKLIIT